MAIVNEAFVQQYFNGENPLGRYFEKTDGHSRFQVIGVVPNARYRDLRGPDLAGRLRSISLGGRGRRAAAETLGHLCGAHRQPESHGPRRCRYDARYRERAPIST
jgi:hypothetical protein